MESYLVPVAVAIGASVASGIFSSIGLWRAHNESKRLGNVESATLIMKLRAPWSNKPFKMFLKDAGNGDALKGRKGEIDSFLNRMETIAMFLEHDTLREVHVKELFAEHFKLVVNNKAIARYYKYRRKMNKKYTYTNIAKVLERMKKWDV